MADLPGAAQFALCVALGISYILELLLEFVRYVDRPSPVLNAAVAGVLVALPFVYTTAITLIQFAPAAAVPPAPGAARRFACLACTTVAALLAVLAVSMIAFMFLAGGPLPPGWGQWGGREDAPPT